MPRRIVMVTGLVLVGVLLAGDAALGAPADKTTGKITVLRTAPGVRFWRADATLWRYFETWSTDVARTADGRLVRVDPFGPRVNFDPNEIWLKYRRIEETKVLQYALRETTQLDGSPAPPDGWTNPDFPDADWLRTATFMQSAYRGVAVVCLRGKFEVVDPARVTALSLDATFQGGAVFYLNGNEIGRAFLPAGKPGVDTLAVDYPHDAFVEPSGCLLRQFNSSISLNYTMTPDEYKDAVKDAELQRRYGLRFRRFEAAVPTTLLRRGTNVLAVEVHRAPARETMFTTVSPKEMGFNLIDQRNFWWNRASLEALTLSADAEPGAIVPNAGPPKEVQLWNWPVWQRVDPRLRGEPGELLRPIRLDGARNGTFAGQVVVSGVKPIRALRADVTDLADARGNVLPKSRVSIRYPRPDERRYAAGLDALVDAVPDEIPMLCDHYRRPLAAMQPVWLTVDVPADARPGDYTGTLSVRAEGLEPADVPVQLHLSDFALPQSPDFVTYMGFVQSPDTLAIRYNVPMWSEPHWKLIERSFAILGTLASKELNIPLIRRTHFGNEHAMLWWVKRPDGTFEPDVHIVERYVALAAKHMGRLPVVVFYLSEGEESRTIPWVTHFDATTGELIDAVGPRWGTDEARDFWKPAFDAFRRILAKHGMEQSMCLGYHADGGAGPEASKQCIDTLKLVASEARWVRLGHVWRRDQRLEKGPNDNPWARVGLVGNYGVFWDTDVDKPFYGWQNPYPVTAYTRGVFSDGSPLSDYRLCPEAILLTGQRRAEWASWGNICDFAGQFGRETFLGMRGFAPWGGDFWPVLGSRGRWRDVISRYNDPSAGLHDPRSSWYTVMLNNYQVTCIVGEGDDGPVSTVRAEVLREGLQEAEARVFVQNALLDEESRAKLGPALAERAARLCRERTRALRYMSEFSTSGSGKGGWAVHFVFRPGPWQERSRQLYDLAAEVANALNR